MYVSILGTRASAGHQSILTARVGESLPNEFAATRVLAVAPSLIEALMQGNAAVDALSCAHVNGRRVA